MESFFTECQRLASRADLTFVVCGDGPQLDTLKDAAAGLVNIRFTPLQPADWLGDLLGLASVHLLPLLAVAADFVLPSKLTDMLASGRPNRGDRSAGYRFAAEVESCGLVVMPGDADAMAAAITRLLDDDALVRALGDAARMRAEQRWLASARIADSEWRLTQVAGQPRHVSHRNDRLGDLRCRADPANGH